MNVYFFQHYHLFFRKEILFFKCLCFSECDIRMSLYVFWLRKGPSNKYPAGDGCGHPRCKQLRIGGGGNLYLISHCWYDVEKLRVSDSSSLNLSFLGAQQKVLCETDERKISFTHIFSFWSRSHEIVKNWNVRLSPETERTSCLTDCWAI